MVVVLRKYDINSFEIYVGECGRRSPSRVCELNIILASPKI